MPKSLFLAFLLASALRPYAGGTGADPAAAVSDWYAGESAPPHIDSGSSQAPIDIGAWHAKPARAQRAIPKQVSAYKRVPSGNELAPWYGRAPYLNPSRPAERPDVSEWFGRKPANAKTQANAKAGSQAEAITPKDLAAWKGKGWPEIPYPASALRKVQSKGAENPDLAYWLGRSNKAPRAPAPERAPDISGWFGTSYAAGTPKAKESHTEATPQKEHRIAKASAHDTGPKANVHEEHEEHAAVESHPKHGEHEEHGGNAAQEQHEAHATHGNTEHGESHESDARPSLAPRPDTGFARARDWEQGYAEVLDYAVQRPGLEPDRTHQGRLVTERIFLKPDGTVGRRAAGQKDLDVLNATLALAGQEDGMPFSMETVAKLPRREAFRLLRQDQSLQGAPGNAHRSLDCQITPPRLRTASSGAEPMRDTVLARWPVYTEEMLFTYLRAIPQRIGYREEVWLQDWGPIGRLIAKPQFATISVRQKIRVRDLETYYVTVDRDDGRRSEFWVCSQGLHPVAVANLADRTQWTLRNISRRKAQTW